MALTKFFDCGGIYEVEKTHRYANCHRYDQSVLSILVANFFNFSPIRYFDGTNNISAVRRGYMGDTDVKICKSGENEKWLNYKKYIAGISN